MRDMLCYPLSNVPFTVHHTIYNVDVFCIFCVLLLFMTMTHLSQLSTLNSMHMYVFIYLPLSAQKHHRIEIPNHSSGQSYDQCLNKLRCIFILSIQICPIRLDVCICLQFSCTVHNAQYPFVRRSSQILPNGDVRCFISFDFFFLDSIFACYERQTYFCVDFLDEWTQKMDKSHLNAFLSR